MESKVRNLESITILLFIVLILVLINGLKSGYDYIYQKGYNAGRDSTRVHITKLLSDTTIKTCKPVNDD